jgi:phosphate transport system protein
LGKEKTMVGKYRDELDDLKDYVRDFGRFSEAMLRDALSAYKENDVALAEDVKSRKERLRYWKHDIEDRSLRLVALYQPMGEDLRTISCINQMNYSIFRVGRIAKNIAKLVIFLSEAPRVHNLSSVSLMGELVFAMIDDVLKAYTSRDLTLIEKFNERDDVVDNLRTSIFRECLTYMMEDPKNIPGCIDSITLSRHLERCADHACLMAEKIYFMVRGEHVEIR